MAKEVVIVSAARAPVGKFLGGLSSLKASQLGAVAVKEAVKRAGIETKEIDEAIMGNVVSAGMGQSPARQALIYAGVPPDIPAFTINKVCGSGLKAVALAAQAIKAGDGDIIVAGGMESMSNVPYYLTDYRYGRKMTHGKLIDGMIYDGIWCVFEDVHMGALGDFTAKNSGITREEQDEYAFNSQRKACEAIKNGKFKEEIISVEVPQRKGEPVIVDTDEGPRPNATLEALARLKPVFTKDGTVTAGNASTINDGAAALVVMSEEKSKEKGITPMARITGYAVGHTEPKMLFYAPIVAVKKLLEKLGKDINYFDLIEINEAFAAQVLADGKELGWDWNRVNVKGGAIALGHPIGATGARILTTLLYALKDKGLKKGLAVLCLGGGGSVGLSVEVL